MTEVAAKAKAISEIIDGQVALDTDRVAVSIKGLVYGFPVTIEAIATGWPFGVMYTIETNGAAADKTEEPALVAPCARVTLYPRIGKGLMSILTRLVLFESSGMSVGDRSLEKQFNFSYDNREVTEQFIRQPGVHDLLIQLESCSKFSELVIKTDAGIYLSQPSAFSELDVGICRTIFKTLGELGQILSEAF